MIQFTAFSLKNEEYAVDTPFTEEIAPMPQIEKMINIAYIKGVINLRSKVIPDIELKEKSGYG